MDVLLRSRRVVEQVQKGTIEFASCTRHADFAGAARREIAVVPLGFKFLRFAVGSGGGQFRMQKASVAGEGAASCFLRHDHLVAAGLAMATSLVAMPIFAAEQTGCSAPSDGILRDEAAGAGWRCMRTRPNPESELVELRLVLGRQMRAAGLQAVVQGLVSTTMGSSPRSTSGRSSQQCD
jgi:hypothetical protein